MTFSQIMILVGVGCLFWIIMTAFVLFACAMGAYFVFRTKKEHYEPFIGTPKGEVFTIPLEDELEEKEEPEKIPDSILKRTTDFMSQMGGSNNA